jgi:heterodisulfide reductase subunit C
MGKPLHIKSARKKMFLDKVREALPQGGNLNLCLTCGACVAGCPATGLLDMDPRNSCVWLPGQPGTPDPFAEK